MAKIQVEVAYAGIDKQLIIPLQVDEHCTAGQALEISNIFQHFPELSQGDNLKIGIFSKSASLLSKLRAGDRVEIYRPLRIDPKQARHQRANARS